MKCLRKLISLATIAGMTVVPLLAVGCNDQSGGAAPTGQTVSAPPKTDGTPAPDAPKKNKKDKKKKKAVSPAEAGSTTGGGTNPPVK